MKTESFTPLPIRKKYLASAGKSLYRVYRKEGDGYVSVEANTASEAFKFSGLTEALRIEREAPLAHALVPEVQLIASGDVVETKIPEPELEIEGEEEGAVAVPRPVQIIPAPKETGATMIRPDDVRFEPIPMTSLGGEDKASPQAAAPAPAPVAEVEAEAAHPASPPVDAEPEALPAAVAEEASAAMPAAPVEGEAEKALSEEEVKKLLGESS